MDRLDAFQLCKAEIGNAGVADLAFFDQVCQTVPGFFDVLIRQRHMDLVQVNNLDVQAAQRIFNFLPDAVGFENIVDHFIIMCDFHGIKAPIGSIAKITNINSYSFIDQETFQYPGTRNYSVVIVTKSGRIIELENFINYTIKTNAPTSLLSQQVNREQNDNPGIRNDIETAGKSYTEKLVRNKRRRRTTTNTIENIVSNTSIVIE